MKWLLDTCVLSELAKKRPDRNVLAWMERIEDDLQFVSVQTVGEIRKGIEKVVDARRRAALDEWFRTSVVEPFSDCILPVDVAVAERWGRLCGEAERAGKPRPAVDSLLAATALAHGLTLATRNVADMAWTGADLFNPFENPDAD